MKLIHCADLHLDSRLSANLIEEKRKERREELLQTFRRMIQYAVEESVEAILIAGDMFDTNMVSATARNVVRQSILSHPDICFYYLRGNHDTKPVFEDGEAPDNLKVFGQEWTYHFHPSKKGTVVIAGAEFFEDDTRADLLEDDVEHSGSIYNKTNAYPENLNRFWNRLSLHPDDINIVMLHGQEAEYKGVDKTMVIPLRELRGKHIDYLALGHIHSYKKGELDARGTWCYPGCLEGRGFDECGEHGFVLLDVDEETGICETEFVPFAQRNLYTVSVDVTGCMSTEEMAKRAEQVLEEQDYSCKSMMKLVLTGALSIDCEKNISLLLKMLQDYFYYIKIYDETELKVDYKRFAKDASLKGEFARLIINAEEIPEEEKAIILRYGIQALAGEEID